MGWFWVVVFAQLSHVSRDVKKPFISTYECFRFVCVCVCVGVVAQT